MEMGVGEVQVWAEDGVVCEGIGWTLVCRRSDRGRCGRWGSVECATRSRGAMPEVRWCDGMSVV